MRKSLRNDFVLNTIFKIQDWKRQFFKRIELEQGLCKINANFLVIESISYSNNLSENEWSSNIEQAINEYLNEFYHEKIVFNNDKERNEMKTKLLISQRTNKIYFQYSFENDSILIQAHKSVILEFFQHNKHLIHLSSLSSINEKNEKLELSNRIMSKIGTLFSKLRKDVSERKKINRELVEKRKNLDQSVNEGKHEIRCNRFETKRVIILNYKMRKHIDIMTNSSNILVTKPIYNQIVRLVAEEKAIDDFLIYLLDGFKNKRIKLDIYLRRVKFLSHEKFIKRATILFAHDKLNLIRTRKLYPNIPTTLDDEHDLFSPIKKIF